MGDMSCISGRGLPDIVDEGCTLKLAGAIFNVSSKTATKRVRPYGADSGSGAKAISLPSELLRRSSLTRGSGLSYFSYRPIDDHIQKLLMVRLRLLLNVLAGLLPSLLALRQN